jgi:hypothetical protein
MFLPYGLAGSKRLTSARSFGESSGRMVAARDPHEPHGLWCGASSVPCSGVRGITEATIHGRN